jgi:hypothetical protein
LRNVFLVAVTSTLSVWVLVGMEEGIIAKDFRDLGVGNSSKGGGCKDYFNLDCMNEPLSDRVPTMDVLFFNCTLIMIVCIV